MTIAERVLQIKDRDAFNFNMFAICQNVGEWDGDMYERDRYFKFSDGSQIRELRSSYNDFQSGFSLAELG